MISHWVWPPSPFRYYILYRKFFSKINNCIVNDIYLFGNADFYNDEQSESLWYGFRWNWNLGWSILFHYRMPRIELLNKRSQKKGFVRITHLYVSYTIIDLILIVCTAHSPLWWCQSSASFCRALQQQLHSSIRITKVVMNQNHVWCKGCWKFAFYYYYFLIILNISLEVFMGNENYFGSHQCRSWIDQHHPNDPDFGVHLLPVLLFLLLPDDSWERRRE